MNIVVYCSSSNNLDKRIIEIAEATGSTIGKTGCNLLYGGVDAGLMHTTAAAASAAGAKIIGVVPDRFKHRADALCNDLRLCIDLNDRKAIMIEHGDIFVVLPGGIGTLDELLSTLSIMKVNNDHRCRITMTRPIRRACSFMTDACTRARDSMPTRLSDALTWKAERSKKR